MRLFLNKDVTYEQGMKQIKFLVVLRDKISTTILEESFC